MSRLRTALLSRVAKSVLEILEQKDPRLLVVVGPCSIHDVDAALDYGARLNALRLSSASKWRSSCGFISKNADDDRLEGTHQ